MPSNKGVSLRFGWNQAYILSSTSELSLIICGHPERFLLVPNEASGGDRYGYLSLKKVLSLISVTKSQKRLQEETKFARRLEKLCVGLSLVVFQHDLSSQLACGKFGTLSILKSLTPLSKRMSRKFCVCPESSNEPSSLDLHLWLCRFCSAVVHLCASGRVLLCVFGVLGRL